MDHGFGGRGWAVVTNGYGACGHHRYGFRCTSNRSIKAEHFGKRVLAAPKNEQFHPDGVEAQGNTVGTTATRQATSALPVSQ